MSPENTVAPNSARGSGLERATGRPAGLAESTPVTELMTRNVVKVAPDMNVQALTSIFLDRGISGAPVVDRKGRTIGIVSKTDVLRDQLARGDSVELPPPSLRRAGIEAPLDPGLHVEPEPGPTVRDVMTPLAFTLPEDASVARASALMALEGVHRLIVVDERNDVVGILSSLDVLRWLAVSEGYVLPKR